MSATQTRTTFSRKTVAIAIASAVTIGGITTPQADAIAGHEGANYWYIAEDGVLSPNTQDKVPTWGYNSYTTVGGIFTDVPTADGLLTGFSGTDVGYTAGSVKDGVKNHGDQPYGEATQLSAMKTLGLHAEAPTRDMSMDAKKMLYVAYSFANDIAQNEGLTQEARDALAAHGYKGDFYDEHVMSADSVFGGYDQVLLSDKKMSPDEIRKKATADQVLVITGADYVAIVASILAGTVYQLDGGRMPVGLNDDGGARPLTFGDMYDRNNFSFWNLDEYTENNDQIEDRYSMAYAMIEIARNVSDEEINNSDIKVYTYEDPENPVVPPFFSLSNSSPAPVEELPQAPVEDIYVDKVERKGDTVIITRNDGKPFKFKVNNTNGIKDVIDNGDGSITIVHDNGDEEKIDLTHTTVTESNKDTPKHTITITVPGEEPFTFNAYDNYIVDVKREDNGNYTVVRRDKTTWEINLKDIRDRIKALEDKDSPTRAEFDKVKKDLANLNARVNKEFKAIDNRFENVEGDIENLRNDLTALENRVTKVEGRLTKVEDRTDALTKCLYGTGMAAIPAALSIPLALLTQAKLPGITQFNTQIQQQIGIYDENLATMWSEHGGILQAGAALSVLAGMIGGLAYIANECAPLTKTDAAQATDLGQLSSKLEQGASRKNAPQS